MEEIISIDQFEWFLKFRAKPLVYFLYSSTNEIIYIGKSINFPQRLSYHSGKAWFEEVGYIKLFLVENEEDIFKKEMELIRIHQPKYNRMGIANRPEDEEELLNFLRENPFATERQLATGVKMAAWRRVMILESLVSRKIISRGAPPARKAKWHITSDLER